MVNPAIQGLRPMPHRKNTPAARGNPNKLYPKAHAKLSLIRVNTVFDRCSSVQTSPKSDLTKITCAASMAISDPAPIAILNN